MEYSELHLEQLKHKNNRPSSSDRFMTYGSDENEFLAYTYEDYKDIPFMDFKHFRIYDYSFRRVTGDVNINKLVRVSLDDINDTEEEYTSRRLNTLEFINRLEQMYKVPRYLLGSSYDYLDVYKGDYKTSLEYFKSMYTKKLCEIAFGRKVEGQEDKQMSHHTFDVNYVLDVLIPIWDSEVLSEGINQYQTLRDYRLINREEINAGKYGFQESLNDARRKYKRTLLMQGVIDKMKDVKPISITSLGINEGYYRQFNEEKALIDAYNEMLFGIKKDMRSDVCNRLDDMLMFIDGCDKQPSINSIVKECGGRKTMAKLALLIYNTDSKAPYDYGFIERATELLNAIPYKVYDEPLETTIIKDNLGNEVVVKHTKDKNIEAPVYDYNENEIYRQAKYRLESTVGKDISMKQYLDARITIAYYENVADMCPISKEIPVFRELIKENPLMPSGTIRFSHQIKKDYFTHSLGWASDFDTAMDMFDEYIAKEEKKNETIDEMIARVKKEMDNRLKLEQHV
jgi:hypothetical protein